MRVFSNFPKSDYHQCPICGTQDEGQTVLVPIDGTSDGGNVEAVPTHVNCIISNIRYSQEHGLMGLEAEKGVQETS